MTATQTDRRSATSISKPRSISGGTGPGPIIANAHSRDDAYQAIIQWLQTETSCAGVGFYLTGRNGELDSGPNNFTGPAFESDGFLNSIQASVAAVASSNTIQQCPVERIRNLTLVSVPVTKSTDDIDVLTAAVVNTNVQSLVGQLQVAAAYATVWHTRQQNLQTQSQLESTAAVLELLSTIESADNFRSGCVALVNILKDHFRCRAVILGLSKRGAAACRIVAMSGMADFDSHAVITRNIEDALDECVVRERLSQAPAEEFDNRDSLLSHQKLQRDLQATRVTAHPLITSGAETIGVWMVVDDAPTATNAEVPTVLRAAACPVADALHLARRADSAFFGKSRTRSTLTRRLLWTAVGGVVATLLLLVPVPYRIHCECSAEPDVRRFIVAPHEGLIEKTFVEAGDVVKQGDLLAKMDGRDVRWELAGLTAEYEQARKENDAGLLSGEIAASQIAALELQRIDGRRQVLLRRKDELELKSPTDGIVLDSHLERVENAPVTIGQAIYEVAPLSPVTVEVAIPDHEYSHVREGYDVNVRFDGMNTDFVGTVKRISPRSEVRDGNNVFIADVVIENDNEVLRPGMNGHAKITGQTRSLGWNLFHTPWEHFRKSLPF